MLENQYIPSFQMLQELGRKVTVGPRPWMLPITVAAVLFALLCMMHPELSHLQAQGTIILIFVALCNLLPELYAATTLRRMKRKHGGKLPLCRITFGETIVLHDKEATQELSYDQITRVRRLKHCYLLMLSRRGGLMVDYYGFTEGSYLELVELLRQKRPDLKIPL